jgi:hypothetical protein
MNRRQLGTLRFVSLLLLLPGLAGLIFAAMVSTEYLQTLPRLPQPADMRMIPRNIHGTVIYETQVLEDSSVVVFLGGLGFGLVYLRKWGIAQALGGEDDEQLAEQQR